MDISLQVRAKQKSLWPSCTETEDSGAEQCDSHQDPFTGTTGSQHQRHRGINTLSYYIELSALILPEKAGNSIFPSHRNVMALVIFKSMLTEVQRPPAIKDLACLINYPFQHYPTSWQAHIALKNREQKAGTNLKITSPSPLSPRWISCIWEHAENSFLQTQSRSEISRSNSSLKVVIMVSGLLYLGAHPSHGKPQEITPCLAPKTHFLSHPSLRTAPTVSWHQTHPYSLLLQVPRAASQQPVCTLLLLPSTSQ